MKDQFRAARAALAASRWMALLATTLLASCGGGGGGGGSSSSISVSPKVLDFYMVRGADLPAPQAVVATFHNGDGVLVGYPPGQEVSSWLAVDAAAYTSGSSVSFTFYVTESSPSGPSEQDVKVRFVTGRADGSNISYVDMHIRLHVTDQVHADMDMVNLAAEYPAASTDSHGVYVRAQGLNWTAVADQPWLKVSPASSFGDANIWISAETAGLAFGHHTGVVTLQDTNGHTETIGVGFDYAMPSMTTSFTGYSGSGVNGATLAGGSATFQLSNSAAATWSVSTDAPWFATASSDSGSAHLVDYSIDPATPALASGTYAGTLTIKATLDATHEVQRTFPLSLALTPATLTVPASPIELQGIASSDGGFTFNATLNTGANAYPVTVTPTSLDGWLVVDAAPATVSASAGTVQGHADFVAVDSGEYDGTIEIAAQVNGDLLTKTVDVHMLREQWRLFTGRNGVALTSQPGVSRLTRVVPVTDTAGGGMAFSASSDQSWLLVSGAGTAPANLTLTADPAGLAAGLYEATVTLTPQSAGADAGEQIRVGLYVADVEPAATLAVSVSQPRDLITDPLRPYAYVIQSGGSVIQAYNVYTGAAGASVAASDVESLAVSTDGSELFAYSGTNKQISVFALPALTPLRSFTNVIELRDREYGDFGNTFSFNYARPSGKPVLVTSRISVLEPADGSILYTRGTSSAPYYNFGDVVAVSGDSTRVSVPDLLSYVLRYRWSDGTAALDNGPYHDYGTGGFNVTDVALDYDGTHMYGMSASPYSDVSYKLVDGTYKMQSVKTCGSTYPGGAEVSVDGLWVGLCRSYYSGEHDVRVYDVDDNLKLSFNSGDADSISRFRVSSDGAQMVWLPGFTEPSNGMRMRRMPDP